MAWRCGLLSAPANDSLICAQANGIIIGAFKTAAADLMAQVSKDSRVRLRPEAQPAVLRVRRRVFRRVFQYQYQVNIFKRIFTATERFTSQSLEKKLKDTEG